jgi:hypothetical protein
MEDSARVSRFPTRTLIVGLAFLASSCVPHGLAFVKDKRLDIVSPDGHSTVNVPVTIRWQVHDFRVTGRDGSSTPDAGFFGVFVDRAPVPPGKPLSWIAHGDPLCLATPRCPDRTYFEDHHTYDTTDTSFRLSQLPDRNAYQGHENHEVTIVLLDGTGRRIGESAWYVDFFYDREGV